MDFYDLKIITDKFSDSGVYSGLTPAAKKALSEI
jgi:hypothetical protein